MWTMNKQVFVKKERKLILLETECFKDEVFISKFHTWHDTEKYYTAAVLGSHFCGNMSE